jgi:hypothetical protein
MIVDGATGRISSLASHQQALTTNRSGLLLVLETVSAYALSFFAAMVNPALYYPFSLVGAAIGFYQYFHSDEIAAADIHSYSFLEQLTRIQFSPFITLGVNTAITWSLIESHSHVFVPIVALYMGAWTGRTIGKIITYLRNISLDVPQGRGDQTELFWCCRFRQML